MTEKQTKKYKYTTKPGAPRSVSFEPDEMIELGKEMLKWVEDHPDMVHLSEWYTIEKMFIYEEWKTFIQKTEFIPYYQKALKLIGIKYVKKESLVEPNLKQRWQRVYFKDLKDQEDEDAQESSELEMKIKKQLIEFDYKMKHEVLENVSEEVKQQYLALMNQLTALQNVKKIGS